MSDTILTITIQLDRQRLIDLLVGAAEGGSTYWASFGDAKPNGNEYTSVHCEEHEAHSDSVPAFKGRIDAETMARGLQLLADWPEGPASNGQLSRERALIYLNEALAENDDAGTSDVILQVALFGELVYG